MTKRKVFAMLATSALLVFGASASASDVPVLLDLPLDVNFPADFDTGYVIASSPDGNPPPEGPATITEYSVPPGVTPHGVAKEEGLIAAQQGGSPNVWFTDLFGNAVTKLDPQTGAETNYPIPGAFGITDVRLTPNGKVWFDTGGNIGVLDPATNTGILYQTNMGFLDWIHLDQFGNVWAAELGGNRIVVLNPDTGIATQYVVGPSPAGITRRKSGDVWWCERGSGQIGRLDIRNNTITHYTTSMTAIEGCAVNPIGDPDGLVWTTPGFAGSPSNGIGFLNPKNSTFTLYNTPTPNSAPYGVSIGCAGSVAFGEDNAHNIGLLVPSQAVGTTTTSVATTTPAAPVSFTPVPVPFVSVPAPFQAVVTTGTSSSPTTNGFREYPTLSKGGEGPHLVVIGPNEKVAYSHITSTNGPKVGILELPPAARCNKQ